MTKLNITENCENNQEFDKINNGDGTINPSSHLLIDTLIHENLNLKNKIKDMQNALELKEKIDQTNQGKYLRKPAFV